MAQKVLAYDRSVVPQEQYWDCGPASAQVVLNGQGVILSENDLITEIGTTVNGTDYVGLVQNALNAQLRGANYTSVYFDGEGLPTPDQSDTLWANIVESIDAGYGLVMNWDSPPNNHPVGVNGSQSPNYGSGEILHYVACMGYDDSGERALWIADPGFGPFGYWISFNQCASLIPPKGYTYATPTSPAPTPAPAPTPTPAPVPAVGGPLFGPDLSNNNWGSKPASAIPAILTQIIAQGFSWIAHKVSEGNHYADPYWPTVWQWGQQTGNRVVGYHYVTTDNPEQQAQTYLRNDPSKGAAPCFLDFEANSGDITNFWAVFNAFVAAGVNMRLDYIPRWYWQQIGSPDLSAVVGLISSAYDYENDYAATEYAKSGGANGNGWQPYGGATPVIWQFTDSAIVAGMSMDANAFEGSLSDLDALLGNTTPSGGGPFMSLTDQQQADLYNAIMGTAAVVSDNNTQLRGPNQKGWPQLGQNKDGEDLTLVDAIAAARSDIAALKAALATGEVTK